MFPGECRFWSSLKLCSVFREWMEGPWGTMDPDKVDGETGNFWRALYKLEKQFTEVPNAQKIAARVRYFSPCTVKSLFNSHLGDRRKWPSKRSGCCWQVAVIAGSTVISLHLRRREREIMLLKLYSIIICTDLVIDIDREKVYFTTRYTGVATR